jgi:hypothetical protein
MAASPPRPNSVLIVGKGEGGGKLDQRDDDDDPGGYQQQHEQRVDDEAATGRAFEVSPEPGQGPGKLLSEQEDDQQKTGIKKDGPDNGILGANTWKGAPLSRPAGGWRGGVGRVMCPSLLPI